MKGDAEKMNLLKKTFGVCLIGFGVGTLLVLLLPVSGWIFGIGVITLYLDCCGFVNNLRKDSGIK